MNMPLEHDRMAQILIASDYGLEVDEARALLEGAQLVVSIDPDAAQAPWGQAALLAVAGTASRMFRGGVHVAGTQSAQVLIGRYFGQPLSRALVRAGCRSGEPSFAC